MAFGDVVGTPGQASDTGVGTLAVTFTSATAGNLLIAGFARSAPVTWGSDPSGWTPLTQVPDTTGNLSAKWYYKIAAGGETSVTATTTETTGTWRGAVAEFEGPFAGSPLDLTAEDESNISTIVTSQSTGTTAATAQADELAVALWTADSAVNVDGGGTRNYSNSFTEVVFAGVTNNARSPVILARRVLTATGTYSCTYSVTDTGDEMYGAIATFKKQAAGGGTSVTPTAATCIATVTAPTPVLGSLSITPSTAGAVASVTTPSVLLGSVTVIPTIAGAIARLVGPVVTYGSASVIPVIASVVARVSAPQVDDGTTEEDRRVFPWERLFMRRRGR